MHLLWLIATLVYYIEFSNSPPPSVLVYILFGLLCDKKIRRFLLLADEFLCLNKYNNMLIIVFCNHKDNISE